MAKLETETHARQGDKGRPVLYVLAAAIILAVVAGAGVLTWQSEQSPPDRASQSQEAARATTSGASNPANREQPANPTQPQPAKPSAQ